MPPQSPYLRSLSFLPKLSRICTSYCPWKYTPELLFLATLNSMCSSQSPCCSSDSKSTPWPAPPLSKTPVPGDPAKRPGMSAFSLTPPQTVHLLRFFAPGSRNFQPDRSVPLNSALPPLAGPSAAPTRVAATISSRIRRIVVSGSVLRFPENVRGHLANVSSFCSRSEGEAGRGVWSHRPYVFRVGGLTGI